MRRSISTTSRCSAPDEARRRLSSGSGAGSHGAAWPVAMHAPRRPAPALSSARISRSRAGSIGPSSAGPRSAARRSSSSRARRGRDARSHRELVLSMVTAAPHGDGKLCIPLPSERHPLSRRADPPRRGSAGISQLPASAALRFRRVDAPAGPASRARRDSGRCARSPSDEARGFAALHFAAASFHVPSRRRRTLVRRTDTCIGRPVRASAKSSVRV